MNVINMQKNGEKYRIEMIELDIDSLNKQNKLDSGTKMKELIETTSRRNKIFPIRRGSIR